MIKQYFLLTVLNVLLIITPHFLLIFALNMIMETFQMR